MSAVSEIMSNKTVLTVRLDSNLSALDISKLMIKKNVGSVIVFDSKDLPIGIITEHDIVRKICAKNLVPDKIQCKEIMTSPVITIMSYDSIDSATKKMNKNKIKRLPVMEENNKVIGILSISDITKHLSKIILDDYKRFRFLHSAIEIN